MNDLGRPVESGGPRRGAGERGRQVALWLALAVLAAVTLVRWAQYRRFVGNDLAMDEVGTAQLADKVNPNTASWASLARLPGVGETRARAIAGYRDEHERQHPGGPPAFTSAADLQRVKGIGPATAAQMEPFLTFENP